MVVSSLNLVLDDAYAETELIRVMTFRSSSADTLPEYIAGAHIEFDLGAAGKRAYSLVDWPDSSNLYTVAVQKEIDGKGGSQTMHALNVGDSVTAAFPQNSFQLLDGIEPVLLLAGGIGITPLISMATQLQQQGRSFQLHYAARNASRMGFSNSLITAYENKVYLYLDDTNPPVLADIMRQQAPDTQVYLCGPRSMIDAARVCAIDAGVSEKAIHIELFTSTESKTGDSAFEVEISNTGQIVHVAADQTIIEALESAGIDVMHDCQRGDCGICQCDVVSGIPDHRDVVLSDSEKASGKVMQICVSRAKSARLVIDV